MSASLITHCDPLFQTICRYNRIARKGSGATQDYTQVRTEIEEQRAFVCLETVQELVKRLRRVRRLSHVRDR